MNINQSPKLSSRHGRFKKKLVSENTLAHEARMLNLMIPELMSLYNSGRILPTEFVGAYILFFLTLRYPHTWPGPQTTEVSLGSTFFSWEKLPFSFCENVQKRLKSSTSIVDIFSMFSLKSTPKSVNVSLIHWAQGLYQLEHLFHVPTPREVLDQQKQGKRCVTTIIDHQVSHYILGERDALSFTLHDLIHAHHFYKNPDHLQGQIGFYRIMANSFDYFNLAHPQFKLEFEYLISDMNAYPIHLLKCLEAAMSYYFDKSYFLSWCELINSPKELYLINTSKYHDATMDEILLDWLKRRPLK